MDKLSIFTNSRVADIKTNIPIILSTLVLAKVRLDFRGYCSRVFLSIVTPSYLSAFLKGEFTFIFDFLCMLLFLRILYQKQLCLDEHYITKHVLIE